MRVSVGIVTCTAKHTPTHSQPVVRSWVAVAAHQRNSAGSMGGSVRLNNKRNRKAAKQQLRGEEHNG